MSAYTPQPGTIAARAIAHMRSLPPGTVLSSAQLAEALDLDDSKAIYPSLSAAVKHGAVHQDAKADNKRILLWSLGDGTPRSAAPSHDPEDLAPLNPVPPIPKDAVIWPGLATPPEDTRPAAVKSAELAWAKGTQKPHRGATPDVGDRRGRPPTTDQGAAVATTTRGKNTRPAAFADPSAMQITNDPITPATKVGGDKYSHLFAKMKLGQAIKCTSMDAPRVAGAMRKWVKEQGTGAIVRAVRKYPADGMGRVWMLKPERAGA